MSYLLILKKFSRLFVVKIFFLVSFSMATPGWTIEPKEYHDAASIIAFADTLFHHGYYYRAIIEYERFSYFYPKHPNLPKAQFNVACSMKSAGDYTSALEIFTSLEKKYEGMVPGIEAFFQKAEVLCLMQDYQSALNQYAEFILHYPQHPLVKKARSAIEKIEKQSPPPHPSP